MKAFKVYSLLGDSRMKCIHYKVTNLLFALQIVSSFKLIRKKFAETLTVIVIY